jgi:sensor histidine kinase regulating citrate/malate metabolism
MPDKNAPAVSFPLAQKDAAGNIVGYQMVHVVVTKHKDPADKNKPSALKTVVLPVVLALFGAVILFWLLMKIKPGRKTDKIINRFEGFGAFFGTDKNN